LSKYIPASGVLGWSGEGTQTPEDLQEGVIKKGRLEKRKKLKESW
jgi:hypothetical protein